tara:strand:- start:2579 stop:3160 length:582 start_codon:yes stop_codon:yes gene_type:complete
LKNQLKLSKAIDDSTSITKKLLLKENEISEIIKIIHNSILKGGKILLCGNGGSAADAQHLAAEFTVRLRPHVNRKPIPAISLSSDISTLTACANDYGYKNVFLRNFQALYKKNDVLLVISTSGNSKNILEVLKYSKKKNIKSIGFLGCKGGLAKKYCYRSIIVPSNITARIQEKHIFLGHFIFESVERLIFRK